MSSAYFPQSNGRAEVAVKKIKRLLGDNVKPNGSLNNDNLLRALLQVRNTPDHESNLSPAEIIFGHPLRDAFSFVNRQSKFYNPSVSLRWREIWQRKEAALTDHNDAAIELPGRPKHLPPLHVGDIVFVQNCHDLHPNKWDRMGTIMESLEHDRYTIKIRGSGRLTMRNRKFLRRRADPQDILLFPDQSKFVNDEDSFRDTSYHTHDGDASDDVTVSGPMRNKDDQLLAISHPADLHQDVSPPDVKSPHLLNENECPSDPVNESPRRSGRVKKPRRVYEPESGKWIDI